MSASQQHTHAPPATATATAKRPASAAGFSDKPNKAVKRRASKACQCCRARKVRCNVIEHGAPCTNCRLDEVPCIVTESKRKRKSLAVQPDVFRLDTSSSLHHIDTALQLQHSPQSCDSASSQRAGPHVDDDAHVPHPLYRSHADRPPTRSDAFLNHALSGNIHNYPFSATFHPDRCQPVHSSIGLPGPQQLTRLPAYIKPLPSRIESDEAAFLDKKRALTVPPRRLRNELLRCYVEFVHPFMPVLDLVDLLQIIQHEDGSKGTVSLFLFQAIMFVGSAYVDMEHLRRAGFSTRRDARKKFYTRARLLYDFDYDTDRVILVQGLLMMTFWYEQPGDLKDTWHWMGVAASLAQTIGLNHDPARSNMPLAKQRLWKRMWWSCVIRDRLIALGMRRPTRIKAEDCDVPMLTLDDFEIGVMPDELTCISEECTVARDTAMQLSLARTCIEKARLCVCVQHVLTAQYSVSDQAASVAADDGAAVKMTTILLPRKADPERSEVKACHRELQAWLEGLHEDVKLRPQDERELTRAAAPLLVNRALLHMVYFTTLSALHRPQVLYESAVPQPATSAIDYEEIETSLKQVRVAASSITTIALELLEADLVRFLPTTGVTVLQPAIISHLLDIKSASEETRRLGLQGFCRCIQVITKMRESYAAADYSLALIEAAVRKADIQITDAAGNSSSATSYTDVDDGKSWRKAWSTDDLINAGLQQQLITRIPETFVRPLTPPPEHPRPAPGLLQGNLNLPESISAPGIPFSDHDVASKLASFLASTPPESDHATTSYNEQTLDDSSFGNAASDDQMAGLEDDDDDDAANRAECDFEALINFDDLADGLATDSAGVDAAELANMQGESSGFTFDMNWLSSINEMDFAGHSVHNDDKKEAAKPAELMAAEAEAQQLGTPEST